MKLKLLFALFFICHYSYAIRREKSFDYSASYFLYPIVSSIPGLGDAYGAGLTINNIAATDIDLTGISLSGDFKVSVFSILNTHLIKEKLILDIGTFNYNVSTIVYERGANSIDTTYLAPRVKGKGHFIQLTNSYYERMFEFFLRKTYDKSSLLSLSDQSRISFETKDQQEFQSGSFDIGVTLDLTDHRYDPYQGIKLESLLKIPSGNELVTSNYIILDLNATAYLPLGSNNTWAFNYFQSDAYITKQESTNYDELKSQIGLNCNEIPEQNAEEKNQCLSIENKRIQERIKLNRYGRATPLGGSQRLRSFENGRYYAGKSRFFGTELRFNFFNKTESFNYFVMKGLRTALQLALFVETGSVAEEKSEINFNKHSYGIGGRIVFKGGTVFRFDFANGNNHELRSTIFIDYPWSLSPMDNSSR